MIERMIFTVMDLINTIAPIGIVFGSGVLIVRMALRHSENITRIKHGYPTLSGDKKKEDSDIVDYSDSRQSN